jgi:hypothetical protein
MDLDALKGKTIDDDTLAAIKAHVGGLQTKAETAEAKARDAAKESIEGRKGLKAKLETALQKLGIDSADDLDSLPEAKGQAEAVKQLEAKLKRIEREAAEKDSALQALQGEVLTGKRNQAIAQAVAKHGFIDSDSAATLIGAKVKQEGDDFLFEADGKLVSIDDGAAWIAKTKTFLVKPAGGGGGGSGFNGTGGNGSTANPWDPKSFNVTEQIKLRREDPARADSLKSAASAAT